jgi:hypothetical protein
MNALRIRFSSTPRLLVVGLLFFTACHRQTPPAGPAPSKPRPQQQPPAANITSSASLLRAMRERYPNWYKTLTFVQKTTITRPSGGELVQTWYEAGMVPGRLRIDTDLGSKTGTLFARDSIYSISSGKLVRADTGLNELLVLGFDVYGQSAARSEAQLRSLGFDLSRFHEGTWQGKPVYVVGANRGDTLSKQFYIDRERLLFVRLLERGRQGRVDVRFEKYQRAGDGWIAVQVVQLVNDKRTLMEEYSDVRVNVPLSEALFDPRQWTTAPHWAKPSPSRQ